MKVLFAVNNENISERIVKKYQNEYKEIISYKNVYYFNAIIKEMQRDKSYDRIVISEDLEPFANNNYDTIDKFLFEKLDSISDEATDDGEKEAQIILICADRRSKSDSILVKLFGIGVYSAIIGKDRSIDEVCRLINTPRTKKEAKAYYRIEAEDVNYQTENDSDVNENEIRSIVNHYKSLGKNEDRYVESFNNIASQYTDAQLRVIIKFLPINVKAVLEAKSAKYQQVVMFGDKQYKRQNTVVSNYSPLPRQLKPKTENNISLDSIEKRVSNPRTGKPIIIPGATRAQKSEEVARRLNSIDESMTKKEEPQARTIEKNIEEPVIEVQQPVVKRGRGRPKKVLVEENISSLPEAEEIAPAPLAQEQPKRGRGRPKKVLEPEIEPEATNLFDIADDVDNDEPEETILPGFESDDEEETPEYTSIQDTKPRNTNGYSGVYSTRNDREEDYNYEQSTEIDRTEQDYQRQSQYDFGNLLSADKKSVAFVGTSKNGTSFLVNNLAMLFSSMGINTAILDTTGNRNSFFIYTKNEEELRKVAYSSIPKLKEGIANGIQVNRNLSVYTSLPGEGEETENIEEIFRTLLSNHSLVLIDCDFNTPVEYFENVQEIYLVQSMDVLTIQPITAFMRDLKNKGALKQEKLRIVFNKTTRIKGLNSKVLVGGMAFYNSPSMSFMTELFNKDKVKFCEIPLDESTYIAYLEALVSCNISLNHYSKVFMTKLKELATMVYPLLSRQSYTPRNERMNKTTSFGRSRFSNEMNDTLEQMNRMKNNY